MLLRTAACVLGASLCCAGASSARAQTYPAKPIRMLTAEAGGGADLMARLVAQGLSESFGQQVVVDNRGAASGAVAGEIVAHAPADGYTLLFFGPSIWLLPFLRKSVPYDPLRDFAPVAQPMTLPDVVVVHPALAAKSIQELVALAKAQPGAINFSTGGSASATHLAGELLKAMAGIDIVRIAYKGTAPALNALIGGQVQLMFPAIAAGMPHVKSGRLRALAVTSAQPTELAPGLPTVAATGLPGYEAVLMLGMFAPAKTPASLIQRLNQEVARVLAKREIKEKLYAAGAEGIGGTPAQFAAVLKSDMAKWGKVIRDARIRDD